MNKNTEQKEHHSSSNMTLKNTMQANAKTIYALAIVMVVTVIAYSSSLFNGFVWDDDNYIRFNPLVQSFNVIDIFSSFSMGNYHPLTMLSLAIATP